MRKIIHILEWIWQMPQHIGAFIFYLCTKKTNKGKFKRFVTKHGTKFYYNEGFYGAVTLGQYVFIGKGIDDVEETVKHEYGHHLQSLILGPLYLFVIGLPSLVHAAIHEEGDYYAFYTERWANELANKHYHETK